jgi:hypothetical protein
MQWFGTHVFISPRSSPAYQLNTLKHNAIMAKTIKALPNIPQVNGFRNWLQNQFPGTRTPQNYVSDLKNAAKDISAITFSRGVTPFDILDKEIKKLNNKTSFPHLKFIADFTLGVINQLKLKKVTPNRLTAVRKYFEYITTAVITKYSKGKLSTTELGYISMLNGGVLTVDKLDLITNFAQRLMAQDRTSGYGKNGSGKIWLPLGLISKIFSKNGLSLYNLCKNWAETVQLHYSDGKTIKIIQVAAIDRLEIDYKSGQGEVYVIFTGNSGVSQRKRVFNPALPGIGISAEPMTLDLLSDGDVDHIVDIDTILTNMYAQHMNNGTYPNLYALTQLVKSTAQNKNTILTTNQNAIYNSIPLNNPALSSINSAQLWQEVAPLNTHNGNPNLQFVGSDWYKSGKKQSQKANKQASATTNASTSSARTSHKTNTGTSSKRNYAQYVLITNPATGTKVTIGGKNKIAKVFVEEYCKLHPTTTLSEMQTILAEIKSTNILSDQDTGRTDSIDGKDWFVQNSIWSGAYIERIRKVIKDNEMDLKP